MAFKGTHDVKSRGSRVWQQRVKVSPDQKVLAGALLVQNTKSLRPGENTYQRKSNIHAGISGIIEIKDRYISIKSKQKSAKS